jgi:molybdenum cofactor biosynthesis protein B
MRDDLMKSESMKEHKKEAPKSVNGAVITLSDSKYGDFLHHKNSDVSGSLIKDALGEKHNLVFYSVIPDDAGLLVSTIDYIIENYDVEIIITTGGTGIGPRDITIETLKHLFDKELNGFGEIFRYESYKELGTGAILSRATAGVYKDKLIIALPGSPNAVSLGLKIILPEFGHLVKHLRD